MHKQGGELMHYPSHTRTHVYTIWILTFNHKIDAIISICRTRSNFIPSLLLLSILTHSQFASVMASHWDEEPNEKEVITPMTIAQNLKKIRNKERALLREELETKQNGGIPVVKVELAQDVNNGSEEEKVIKPLKMVREHINLCKAKMRNDPRPIDSTCGCYTCKGFSRAYLHHLFKAKETLGGTLVRPHIVLYCTLFYRTVLYCTVLYCTVLYCTVLYCTVLYCTVLYCTVLCCTAL